MHTDDANGVIEGRRERKREARTGDERERGRREGREEARKCNKADVQCWIKMRWEREKKERRKEGAASDRKEIMIYIRAAGGLDLFGMRCKS